MGGPGSGRKGLSVEEHKRRGTYRRDRHDRRPKQPPAEVRPLPNPPPDSSAGDQLVASVEAVFELDPAERELLRQAGRTLDELQRMEEVLRQMAPVGLGSAKQVMANPLLNEVRQHRLLLQSLLKQLRVEATEGTQTSLASVVQLSRWQKEHRANET